MLWRVELVNYRYVTSVEADFHAEAWRKAWKKIIKEAPELAKEIERLGIVIYPERGGTWGKNEGI